MSFGLRLTPTDRPIDVAEMNAKVSALPGARPVPHYCRGESWAWWLMGGPSWQRDLGSSGGPPLLIVTPTSVSLNLQWCDNVFGHGGAVVRQVLEQYTCTGQDLDYGNLLPDRAACLRWLDGHAPVSPNTLENANRLLEARLEDSVLIRVSCSLSFELSLTFRDVDGREAAVVVDEDRLGEPPAGLLAAYARVGELLAYVRCAEDNTLTLDFEDGTLVIPGAPGEAELWRIEAEDWEVEPAEGGGILVRQRGATA